MGLEPPWKTKVPKKIISYHAFIFIRGRINIYFATSKTFHIYSPDLIYISFRSRSP